MSAEGATPLIIDTGAFYARLDERDVNHEQAVATFEAIRAGDPVYRPLYTSGYILAELVTLGLIRANRGLIADAVEQIRSSSRLAVLHPDEHTVERAIDKFQRYQDQDISLVDHITGVLADQREVTHVFTFDPDDFRTLGLTPVPADT